MSSFFDDLESQLRHAARERLGSDAASARPSMSRRVRAWLGAGARGVPVAVAVATTVAILVVALVLVHHGPGGPAQTPGGGSLPNLSSPQARRELGYIQQANAATKGSPACVRRALARPSVIHGSPNRALTSILGVLRRPSTPADRLSAREVLGSPVQVYAGAARRALRVHGVAYYVIPAREDPAAGQPSARCFAVQRTALDALLPKIPASLRAPTRVLQAQLIAVDRRLISERPYDMICTATRSHNSGSVGCGDTAAQVRRSGTGLQENGATFSGVVPDGVASVTLRFPASAGHPATSVTGPVTSNVFAVPSGRQADGARDEPTVIWRARDGQVLRTITQPSAGTACRKHPVECLAITSATHEQASSSSASATVPTQPTSTTH
jgi:hypothetical protein